jgi:hypothetical protein
MRLPSIGLSLALLLAALTAREAAAQRAGAWSDIRCADMPMAFEGISRCQLRVFGAPRGAQGQAVEYLARATPRRGEAAQRETVLWLLWFFDDWVYQPYGAALSENIIRTQIQPALTSGAGSWSAIESFGTTAFLTFESRGKQCVGFDHGGPLTKPARVEAPGYPWILRGIVCERRPAAFTRDEVTAILQSIRLRKGEDMDAFGAKWGEAETETAEAEPAAATTEAPAAPRPQVAPLALSWQDVVPLASGVLSLDPQGGSEGKMTFVIPRARLRCTGFWRQAPGSADAGHLPTGTWAISCPGGDTASGTWQAESATSGSGEGQDTLGRRVTLRYGG